MSLLVIAPHPDDEVLGVGGTIARLVNEGRDVSVAIVTKGEAGRFGRRQVERVRTESISAHDLLGVKKSLFLDLPAARLDSVAHGDLNEALVGAVEATRPKVVFLPFRGDLHLDHRLVFDSAMVALRPTPSCEVEEIYAYETLSETNWHAGRGVTPNFAPDCFVRLGEHLQRKLDAMKIYRSQVRDFPDERSVEALTALARYRGANVGTEAAEAFMTIRRLL